MVLGVGGGVGVMRRVEAMSRVVSVALGDSGDEWNELGRSSVPVVLRRGCGSSGDSL